MGQKSEKLYKEAADNVKCTLGVWEVYHLSTGVGLVEPILDEQTRQVRIFDVNFEITGTNVDNVVDQFKSLIETYANQIDGEIVHIETDVDIRDYGDTYIAIAFYAPPTNKEISDYESSLREYNTLSYWKPIIDKEYFRLKDLQSEKKKDIIREQIKKLQAQLGEEK
ncbi:hypothetical protein NVP1101O_078 [Vibrio phage 1.101.O._10N.261.45.C6]|nr:hypothetical protein NVP1101O_078 [Vibrio phage 1.101.O._10N.261.45.C6]